jgi:putative transposase
VRRAFRYRLWTNANQERELAAMIETHRRLYNSCLGERKSRYEAEKVTVKYTEQSARYKAERQTNPFYARLNFSSAQATMRRLDKAFKAFFRRAKAGERPGYPRFKSKDRFDSIEFPAYGDGIRLNRDRLYVQHVGVVRVKLHRSIEGTIKTVTLKREADKWYVAFSCDLGDVRIEPSTNPPVGIDVGLEKFLSKSDGSKPEPNPRYLKDALPELRGKQRSLSRKKQRGKNRRKARKAVAKVHARAKNLRREHHHQVALTLVRRYGLIAVESLSIKNMLGNDRLARAISDVAWGNFLLTLRCKAEKAGVAFVEVHARGTSQECSGCGQVVPKDLSQRWHSCQCGCSLDRDENAARKHPRTRTPGLDGASGGQRSGLPQASSEKPPASAGGVVTDALLEEPPPPLADGFSGDAEFGCNVLVVQSVSAGQDDPGPLRQLLGTLGSRGPNLQGLPLAVGEDQFGFGTAFGHGRSPLRETVPSQSRGRNICLTEGAKRGEMERVKAVRRASCGTDGLRQARPFSALASGNA